MMTTSEEKLLVQIFTTKNRIISQVKQQTELYNRHLASKALLNGVTPPSWLFTHSTTSQELSKEDLISELLPPGPSSLPPVRYSVAGSSRYSRPFIPDFREVPEGFGTEAHALIKGGPDGVEVQSTIVEGNECIAQNTSNYPLEIDVSSPADNVEARVSNIYTDPDLSLARIKRSRSRQKAIEQRNSATSQAKRSSANEGIPRPSFSGNRLFALDHEQTCHSKNSNILSEPCAKIETNEPGSVELPETFQVAEEDESREKSLGNLCSPFRDAAGDAPRGSGAEMSKSEPRRSFQYELEARQNKGQDSPLNEAALSRSNPLDTISNATEQGCESSLELLVKEGSAGEKAIYGHCQIQRTSVDHVVLPILDMCDKAEQLEFVNKIDDIEPGVVKLAETCHVSEEDERREKSLGNSSSPSSVVAADLPSDSFTPKNAGDSGVQMITSEPRRSWHNELEARQNDGQHSPVNEAALSTRLTSVANTFSLSEPLNTIDDVKFTSEQGCDVLPELLLEEGSAGENAIYEDCQIQRTSVDPILDMCDKAEQLEFVNKIDDIEPGVVKLAETCHVSEEDERREKSLGNSSSPSSVVAADLPSDSFTPKNAGDSGVQMITSEPRRSWHNELEARQNDGQHSPVNEAALSTRLTSVANTFSLSEPLNTIDDVKFTSEQGCDVVPELLLEEGSAGENAIYEDCQIQRTSVDPIFDMCDKAEQLEFVNKIDDIEPGVVKLAETCHVSEEDERREKSLGDSSSPSSVAAADLPSDSFTPKNAGDSVVQMTPSEPRRSCHNELEARQNDGQHSPVNEAALSTRLTSVANTFSLSEPLNTIDDVKFTSEQGCDVVPELLLEEGSAGEKSIYADSQFQRASGDHVTLPFSDMDDKAELLKSEKDECREKSLGILRSSFPDEAADVPRDSLTTNKAGDSGVQMTTSEPRRSCHHELEAPRNNGQYSPSNEAASTRSNPLNTVDEVIFFSEQGCESSFDLLFEEDKCYSTKDYENIANHSLKKSEASRFSRMSENQAESTSGGLFEVTKPSYLSSVYSTYHEDEQISNIRSDDCPLGTEADGGLQGVPLTKSLPCSGGPNGVSLLNELSSPGGRFWEGSSSQSNSSGRRLSSNPEFECFTIKEDSNISEILFEVTKPSYLSSVYSTHHEDEQISDIRSDDCPLGTEANGGLQGVPLTKSLPCSGGPNGFSTLNGFSSPEGRFWEGYLLRSNSSGKRLSSNPEFECFTIKEDPYISEGNESADDDSDKLFKDSESLIVNSHAIDSDKFLKDDNSLSMHGAAREPLTETHNTFKSSLCTSYKKKGMEKDSQTPLLVAGGKRMAKESLNNRYKKLKTSGKPSLKNEPLNHTREPYGSNIVSNVTSFIPLVQQKQAKACPGKREVKVKALEAAETAKRQEEKRENERKLKKEALQKERARAMEQEKAKQIELTRKKKEDEQRRKDGDMALRKRLREEEERKEERKRTRIEETQRKQRDQEDKLRAKKAGNMDNKRKSNHELKPQQIKKPGEQVKIDNKSRSAATSSSNIQKASTCLKEGSYSTDLCDNKQVNCTPDKSKTSYFIRDNIQEKSYEISPYHCSDDEDDEDDELHTKKFIPAWASKNLVAESLSLMREVDPSVIFPPESRCSLSEVLLPRTLQQVRLML